MTASFHLYQHYYLFNHIYHRLLSCLWETFANHLLNIRKLTVLSGIWRSFYWIFVFFRFSTSLSYCLFLPLSSLTYSLTSNIVKEKTQMEIKQQKLFDKNSIDIFHHRRNDFCSHSFRPFVVQCRVAFVSRTNWILMNIFHLAFIFSLPCYWEIRY